jgi:inhibitor of cysteine peptidase
VDIARIRFVLALAAVAVSLAVIGVSSALSPVVTDKDDGKTVQMSVDQALFVRLPSNPTTGYSWTLTANPAPLALIKSDFAPDAAKNGVMGAGGTQILQFAAKDTGTATISLGYRRPWEKDTPPARTFTVTITISGTR